MTQVTMLLRSLTLALAACGAPSVQAPATTPGSQPAADPTTTTTPRQATFYRRGRFVDRALDGATEHDGCLGSPEQLRTCQQLRPAERCDLAEWPDAGSIRCSGAAMTPGLDDLPRPPQACACTCTDEYRTAYAAWSQRAQACSRVP
jgi:hypothetical protein